MDKIFEKMQWGTCVEVNVAINGQGVKLIKEEKCYLFIDSMSLEDDGEILDEIAVKERLSRNE